MATFSGAKADLNNALNGLVYEPTANTSGNVTLTITTTETGGGIQSDTDTITISLSAVNDAPTITLPATQEAIQNSDFEISVARGNAITIVDDASDDPGEAPDGAWMEVEITVTKGIVTLKDITGLIAASGTNGSAAMSYWGPVNAYNTAFEGMTFTPENDYQGAAQIQFRINDQGGYGSGGAKEITESLDISVITSTDNLAPTNITLDSDTIAESQPIGTTTGTFSAVDPNTGNTHTFTLTAGTGDTNNASFTIDGEELKAAESFDFESKDEYSIRVKVTDSGGLSFEKAFTIDITDVPENEAPTDILLDNDTIGENEPAGTVVGKLTVEDVDNPSADVGRYTSIAVDSYDVPHISYYDHTNKDLKYATWDDGDSWEITTLDEDDDVGKYSSIVIKEDIHI